MSADSEKVRRAEEKLAGRYADKLARIHAQQAALAELELRVLADAFALTEKQKARIESRSSRERDIPLRSMALELGMAVRVNDRTMQTRMSDAHELLSSYSDTVAALAEGRISRHHAQVIQNAGRVLEDASTRADFERIVLAYAEEESVSRTKRFAKSRAAAVDPRPMQERHETAMRERRVWVTDLDDSMSTLTILAGSVEVHGAFNRLTGQGKAIKDVDAEHRRTHAKASEVPAGVDQSKPGGMTGTGVTAGICGGGNPAEADDVWFDDRKLDEIRADLVLDMLLTAAPTIDPTDKARGGLRGITAEVQVTIPITTLTGVTANGAELNGVTPVDPVTARRLAGSTRVWDRVMTDPITGVVTAVDRYTRHPSQTRYLNARDVTCRTPGCRRPARCCDIDHSHDFALGGETCNDNLCNECLRHHTLKHATAWHVEQFPGGVLKFTSPGGKTYMSKPPPRIVFVPTDEGAFVVPPS